MHLSTKQYFGGSFSIVHDLSKLYITTKFTHFRGVSLRKGCDMEKVVDILKQHTIAHEDLAYFLAHIHPALNV